MSLTLDILAVAVILAAFGPAIFVIGSGVLTLAGGENNE